MHFNFTNKELTHGCNLQGKNIGGYEQNQFKLERQFRPLEKQMAFSQAHHEHSQWGLTTHQ